MIGDKLQFKLNVLTKVAKKHSPNSALEALACFGGFEIAMMVGAYIEAYKQNMIILVDGFISTAAILTAKNMEASILDNCIFSHQSDESGHALMLQELGVEAVLKLSLRLGEGSGIAIAFPVITSAIRFLREMSSFEDAGVSNKE